MSAAAHKNYAAVSVPSTERPLASSQLPLERQGNLDRVVDARSLDVSDRDLAGAHRFLHFLVRRQLPGRNGLPGQGILRPDILELLSALAQNGAVESSAHRIVR